MHLDINRKTEKHPGRVLIILAVILVLSIIVSLAIGRYPITPSELFRILFGGEGVNDPNKAIALFNIRLPRICMACLVGACLAAAGAAYQGVFQNPMASPDVLGASNGAAFGAASAILLGAAKEGITAGAFLFSLVAVALSCFISMQAKGTKILNLVLAGMMVSSLFSAGTSYLKLVADPNSQLQEITYWMMGSLNGITRSDVVTTLIPMLIGLLPLILLRWRMNILTLGDEEARTMGVNVTATRLVVIVAATLVTAASISATGMIGWIGLVIPHMARKLVGNNYRYLMPASMLFGASFLLWVDDVSRNLLATEIPIGILTAFVGAPFFMYLIARKENRV